MEITGLMGEKYSSPGVNGFCWEEFKLDFKGERDKNRLTTDEFRDSMPVLGMRSKAKLKSICNNAHNMANKQKELEAPVQLT